MSLRSLSSDSFTLSFRARASACSCAIALAGCLATVATTGCASNDAGVPRSDGAVVDARDGSAIASDGAGADGGMNDAASHAVDARPPQDTAVAGDAGSPPDAGASDDGGPTEGGIDADLGLDGAICMPAGSCTPFDPGSCPANDACQPMPDGAECIDLALDPGEEGAPCQFLRDCAAGFRCADFGGGPLCHRMCPAGSVGACPTNQVCTGNFGDPCVRVCRPAAEPCDIYAQDCADPGDACTLVRNPETDAAYTGCRPEGPRASGQSCGGADGLCAQGLVCIREAGGGPTCHRVCRTEGEPSCIPGEECTGTSRTWMVTYCR